ncbi:hypothetical protein Bbelb_245820 [Branchiostoma belcheri]|nr:hypothetical protein Bbelb_245820 [Branchiostoma belcheri]
MANWSECGSKAVSSKEMWYNHKLECTSKSSGLASPGDCDGPGTSGPPKQGSSSTSTDSSQSFDHTSFLKLQDDLEDYPFDEDRLDQLKHHTCTPPLDDNRPHLVAPRPVPILILPVQVIPPQVTPQATPQPPTVPIAPPHTPAAPAPVAQNLNTGPGVFIDLNKSGELSADEQQVATSLVRRMYDKNTQSLQCKTGGQPLTFRRVTNPRKSSADVGETTARKRVREVEGVREVVSGGAVKEQLAREMRSIPRAELHQLFRDMQLDQVRIPDGHLLAMQVDIGVNYNQLRKLRRWLKRYGVTVESERVSRKISKALLSNIDIHAELMPLAVKTSQGTNIELLPCAYITNLTTAVHDNITRSANARELTWHDGYIPEDEVWVKVLGDHGGGSFKMACQTLNKLHPNSKTNTVVNCVFKAKDYRQNVLTATGHFAEDIKTLQVTTWRSPDAKNFKTRVFAASDYALLSLWYGISGACGVHPCLWCEVTQADMRLSKDSRPSAALRSLTSLTTNYQRFMAEGKGNIKKAKDFKNVIAIPMFNIPLDQVCVPGLHISLGLYQKMFKMLESDLQDLDMLLATTLASGFLEDPEIDRAQVLHDFRLHGLEPYVEAVDAAREVEDKAACLQEQLEERENELAWVAYMSVESDESDDSDDEDGDDPTKESFQQLQEEIKSLQESKMKLEKKAAKIRKDAKISVQDGPLSKQLDGVLKSFHVKRQAYHGQAFVGNHVHTMLQDTAIESLTSIPANVAADLVDDYEGFPLSIVTRSKALKEKYQELFKLYAKCHHAFSKAKPLSEEEISVLDTDIKNFMEFYRREFPSATIPIKMHLLEDHVVPWIRRWKFGLGFHGEQGIEEIHAAFNNIERTTYGIADSTQQILSILHKHMLSVSPGHVGGVPEPKRRK